MGRSCACYLWEKTAPVVSQPFSSLQRSRAGQALPTWGGSWDWNGFTHINILAFIFNIGVPIVCAVWHINKAEELNFSIHRAWAKQGTQTFSMMNFSFHSALAPQSIRAPTVMRAPVHLELFIWVTRWYGLSIPAKLVLICSRDQMQKRLCIPRQILSCHIHTRYTHRHLTTFCSQKILSFIMHIPSSTNTTMTDVPWQLSSLSFSPNVLLSNEKQALGEKFAWKVITWEYVSIPGKHSGSVSQQNCLQA